MTLTDSKRQKWACTFKPCDEGWRDGPVELSQHLVACADDSLHTLGRWPTHFPRHVIIVTVLIIALSENTSGHHASWASHLVVSNSNSRPCNLLVCSQVTELYFWFWHIVDYSPKDLLSDKYCSPDDQTPSYFLSLKQCRHTEKRSLTLLLHRPPLYPWPLHHHRSCSWGHDRCTSGKSLWSEMTSTATIQRLEETLDSHPKLLLQATNTVHCCSTFSSLAETLPKSMSVHCSQ